MQEREGNNPDNTISVMKAIVKRAHENIRLEAMWDSSIADPEIHLTEAELDEFLQTFSEDEKMAKIKKLIKTGTPCEIKRIDGQEVKCDQNAVGSIDWKGVLISDSTLVCRQDLRGAYSEYMIEDVMHQGLYPDVTINGKQLPKPSMA